MLTINQAIFSSTTPPSFSNFHPSNLSIWMWRGRTLVKHQINHKFSLALIICNQNSSQFLTKLYYTWHAEIYKSPRKRQTLRTSIPSNIRPRNNPCTLEELEVERECRRFLVHKSTLILKLSGNLFRTLWDCWTCSCRKKKVSWCY